MSMNINKSTTVCVEVSVAMMIDAMKEEGYCFDTDEKAKLLRLMFGTPERTNNKTEILGEVAEFITMNL